MKKTPSTGILSPGDHNHLRLLWIICLFLYTSINPLHAQEVKVEAANERANTVLLQLASAHNIQLSFDDRFLSRYRVTLSGTFPSPGAAIREILKDVPVMILEENDIFILLEKKPVIYRLSGRITDAVSGEELPFSHIITEEAGLISDDHGNFFISGTDSLFDLTVSYLGYYRLDTTLSPGAHHLELNPSALGIGEVTIEERVVERAMSNGETPGVIRLNHQTARRLPGNGDNSVFNYLRLQPGILAAGEQSGDLIIWGGYEGHSKVIFDGMTIYGLKNFNDNISAVNPLMVKDVMVLKGGYGPEFGDRVGGIVNITGIQGNRTKSDISLNINNMTASGFGSVPLFGNSTLMAAFRRTYYNLYNAEDFGRLLNIGGNREASDISIVPEYDFGDLNLKYAGRVKHLGSFGLSYFQGSDLFTYGVDREQKNRNVIQEINESNRQSGAALNWNKSWQGGGISAFTASYSLLNKQFGNSYEIRRLVNDLLLFDREATTENRVGEMKYRLENQVSLNTRNRLLAGIEFSRHSISIMEQLNNEILQDDLNHSNVVGGFISDRISVGSELTIVPGIRVDMPLHLDRPYLQPRVSLEYAFTGPWKTYLAWGRYNQFITQASVVDDNGNYQYFWSVADNEEIPVLESWHHVGGISFDNQQLSVSMEGYYRSTEGLTRYIQFLRMRIRDVFPGYGRSYGADISARFNTRRHEYWLSYTWSKTLEYFSYFPEAEFRFAPHDQRHEIKSAIMLDFNPLYISMNYVYGSGFIEGSILSAPEPERYPYSRLDAAVVYRFAAGRLKFEAGASVLNVLNTENIKYANFIRVPADQLSTISIHAEAVPFTPTLYLKASF